MTVYRVGPRGASVFGPDGASLGRLHPGYVVVEDVLDEAEAVGRALGRKLAARPATEGRRVRVYADKAIHPSDRDDKGS